MFQLMPIWGKGETLGPLRVTDKKEGSWGTQVFLTLGFPSSEEGCLAGMEIVSCANRCPHSCSDLQEGVACKEDQACQPGCRCPEGTCPRAFWKAGLV